MKRSLIKKVAIWSISIFFVLVAVLAVHIYVVTRHKATASTRIMARIDIKQPITPADASKITTWFYQQQGVDHVLVNPTSDIVIFTYSPLKNNANELAQNFKSTFSYENSRRFMPTEEEMDKSCPASTSFTFRAYKFIKHIF